MTTDLGGPPLPEDTALHPMLNQLFKQQQPSQVSRTASSPRKRNVSLCIKQPQPSSSPGTTQDNVIARRTSAVSTLDGLLASSHTEKIHPLPAQLTIAGMMEAENCRQQASQVTPIQMTTKGDIAEGSSAGGPSPHNGHSTWMAASGGQDEPSVPSFDGQRPTTMTTTITTASNGEETSMGSPITLRRDKSVKTVTNVQEDPQATTTTETTTHDVNEISSPSSASPHAPMHVHALRFETNQLQTPPERWTIDTQEQNRSHCHSHTHVTLPTAVATSETLPFISCATQPCMSSFASLPPMRQQMEGNTVVAAVDETVSVATSVTATVSESKEDHVHASPDHEKESPMHAATATLMTTQAPSLVKTTMPIPRKRPSAVRLLSFAMTALAAFVVLVLISCTKNQDETKTTNYVNV